MTKQSDLDKAIDATIELINRLTAINDMLKDKTEMVDKTVKEQPDERHDA